jgi:signal transduction histidine kinase/CheY-like chemotaxis protein
MSVLHRFSDWPLRLKMALLLVVASLLPLGVATWISISEAREQLRVGTGAVLSARGDQLVGGIDTLIRGYQGAVQRLARVPGALQMLQSGPVEARPLRDQLQGQLGVWPASDAQLRGVAVLDVTGTVVVATETALTGVNLAYRGFVQEALQGKAVISDVYISETATGAVPSFAVLAPMWGEQGRQVGVAAFWIRATALSDMMKQSNELAGPGSFAILFDRFGIRIAHSSLDDMVYRPGLALSPEILEAQVAEERFGPQTRQLLLDVRQVSPEFALTAAALPATVFRGYAPGNQQWNHVVARRCETVNWTAYYLAPEIGLQAQLADMTRQKLLFAVVIALLALLGGTLFAAFMLKPVRALSTAARAIAGGNLAARVGLVRGDELGELGRTFDTMAGRIQAQAAELQQQSEAQYRALFESLTEGFCTVEVIFDANGNAVDFLFLDTNPAFFGHTGIEQPQGRRMREIAPDLEEYWFELFGKVARTGVPARFENDAKPLGRYYDVRAFRVGGEGSNKVAIVFSDITERHNTELKRQSQLERLALLQQITRAIGERQDLPSIFQVVIRTLEDQLPLDFCCICMYEPADNQLLVTSVGLRSQELAMELALTEQVRFDIDENGLSTCVRGKLVYEPDVSQVTFPFPQRLARGGLRSLVAAPLLVESQVFGVLIAARHAAAGFSSVECEFLQQLSEHVALASHNANLYASLQAAYDDLRATQQAAMQQERLRSLGQMASGIAHDINNAISPVALYTDSLLEREPGLTDQGRGQLLIIQRAIHDVAATVARMREFYRQREPQFKLAPVQLNELVPQVVELTRARWSSMAQEHGITIQLHTELQKDLPVIMGAEGELREALTNLVLNAVDAMPEGGTLGLRTRTTAAGQVQVEVSDTGIGMDEDARRRCLEPFYTTKGERGTGLGLAMVYGAVQRHSAEVEIESVVGKGTTIRLVFAAAADAAIEPALTAAVAVLNGLRILVVDDDPVLLRSMRDTLEGDRHHVVTANGGKEGVARFQEAFGSEQPFSVVITDLGMPYMDGRQVAAAIKALAPRTPVIMLTGWGQRLMADGDIPAHVDIVLSKPPKLRDLREALVQACTASMS